MDKKKFRNYEKRPCKFIMRNGNAIFGVIWENNLNKESCYFFTSNREFEEKVLNKNQITGYPVNSADIIHAELVF